MVRKWKVRCSTIESECRLEVLRRQQLVDHDDDGEGCRIGLQPNASEVHKAQGDLTGGAGAIR
jgi:hypothetical protein